MCLYFTRMSYKSTRTYEIFFIIKMIECVCAFDTEKIKRNIKKNKWNYI